jgi:hypothetical protein
LTTVWPLLCGVSFTTTPGTCGIHLFTDLQALQNYEQKFIWKSALRMRSYIVFGHMSVTGRRCHAGIRNLFGLNLFANRD